MYDVAIIGGGICGASLLYQLSRYNTKALLLEKQNDVGVGTTKANSAIVHAGYDPEPGTLMALYNVEGNRLTEELCAALEVPYKKPGSLVLAFSEAERPTIEELYNRGVQNGVPGLEILGREALKAREPAVADEAVCALYAPSAGIVSPWELAIAQAEAAVEGGAEVRLDTEVQAIEALPTGGFRLETSTGPVEARAVVNAAGIHAGQIARMAGDDSIEIHPNRGEYFLLDTTQGSLVNHIVFQCPSAEGKGVLVAPTVHGNLIVGPNAEALGDPSTATTATGLDEVRNAAVKSVPGIGFRDNIRNFAGLRAYSNQEDFIVGQSPAVPGLYNIAGIKSPGLTAAPAIAKAVAAMLLENGTIQDAPNPRFASKRRVTRFKELSGEERCAAIEANPLYGTIVCRCQTVTEGEIVDALHRPLPPRSLDAVKRRCTAGMGRCQGGFCGPRVQAIIARELGLSQKDIPQDAPGTYIITGETKSLF